MPGLDRGFAPPARVVRTALPRPSELAGVRLVDALERGIGAEERVPAHVGAVAARRRLPAERLGDAADVMRRGAAADAEVRHAQVARGPRELGQLVPVAGE